MKIDKYSWIIFFLSNLLDHLYKRTHLIENPSENNYIQPHRSLMGKYMNRLDKISSEYEFLS